MAGKDIVKNPVPRAQGVKSQNKFILSFSDLTPASSMPSDLIRGSGQAPNPDLYIVVIVRLDRTIQKKELDSPIKSWNDGGGSWNDTN